ncbi:hypothetical protein EYF80_038098 [Liparis tanakae]|uniref:Uncharacterized protein n=1 Tax=Liparis tanakae TaxID=230148 RepID=A0A4Z2GDM5_9TELE|nr:hypothetical protein EYF80_038098 [Liparis tanakae]
MVQFTQTSSQQRGGGEGRRRIRCPWRPRFTHCAVRKAEEVASRMNTHREASGESRGRLPRGRVMTHRNRLGDKAERDTSESASRRRHRLCPRRLAVYLLRGVGGRRRPRLGGLFGLGLLALRGFRGEQDGTPGQRRAGVLQVGEEGIWEGGGEKKGTQQR